MLKNILAIAKKELGLYFNSINGYIILILFLSISIFIFVRTFFINNQNNLDAYFNFIPYIYLFFIPAISMGLFSEETKTGNIEVLKTLPTKPYEIVLGKFLFIKIFLFITLFLTSLLPISISFFGNLDFGVIMLQYIGAYILGISLSALCIFVSKLTKNQIVSFLVSLFASFVFMIIGSPIVTYIFHDTSIINLLLYLSTQEHFKNISIGIIDIRDIVYFLSFIFIFLYLTIFKIKSK